MNLQAESVITGDTIYAESTPRGRGGISITRISGDNTRKILQEITIRDQWVAHLQCFTRIVNRDAEIVDEVMVVLHPGPHSYTGEDLAEISSHGNPVIVDQIMETIHETRLARPALGGEFTKKAFLNSRIDLAQAEAVDSMISAKSATGLDMARRLLSGEVSTLVYGLSRDIRDIMERIEASFVSEDIEVAPGEIAGAIGDIIQCMDEVLRNSDQASTMLNGIRTTIAGRPNAGKSSLFNRLIGEQRAIVHEDAGTTRDVIKEHLLIDGRDFIFHDTAGIKEISAGPEQIGINKAMEAMEFSDLVLYVVDAGRGLDPEEKKWIYSGKKTFVVMNKTDLPGTNPVAIPGIETLKISAKYNKGIDCLRGAMVAAFSFEPPGIFMQRHILLMEKARDHMKVCMSAMDNGLTLDAISLDLGDALEDIEKIIGQGTGTDVLDQVFERFCVGK